MPAATPDHTFLTLAEKLSVEVDLNAHTGIRSFENAVLAELPYLGCSSTVNCNLCSSTPTKSWQIPYRANSEPTTAACVIARPCSAEAAHKEQIKGEAKTIRVLRGKTTKSHRKSTPDTDQPATWCFQMLPSLACSNCQHFSSKVFEELPRPNRSDTVL